MTDVPPSNRRQFPTPNIRYTFITDPHRFSRPALRVLRARANADLAKATATAA